MSLKATTILLAAVAVGVSCAKRYGSKVDIDPTGYVALSETPASGHFYLCDLGGNRIDLATPDDLLSAFFVSGGVDL